MLADVASVIQEEVTFPPVQAVPQPPAARVLASRPFLVAQQRKAKLRRAAAQSLARDQARRAHLHACLERAQVAAAALDAAPARPALAARLPSFETAEVFAPTETEDGSMQGDELRARLRGGLPRVHVTAHDLCPNCTIRLVRSLDASLLTCQLCGHTEPFLESTVETLAYGDDRDFTSFSYKRLGHFVNVVSSFQAKEASRIPFDILYCIMLLLVDEGVRSPAHVTAERVRACLRRLNLVQHYRRITQIVCRITGLEPPTHTPEQEKVLANMFRVFSAEFDRSCGTLPHIRRVNMLSYKYLHYKFCELQGYDEFLPYIGLLKGRNNLAIQDEIFYHICTRLKWEFYPTIR
jgi:hypothetical protein